MTLSPPFSPIDLLRAVGNDLPENAPQERSKPRASGLAHCSRQQAYSMANTPKTNLQEDEHPEAAFTQEQGRVVEDITCEAMGKSGFPVIGRQVTLPDDYFVTGHIDGIMGKWVRDEEQILGTIAGVPVVSGTIEPSNQGFEHKHFGRYKYLEIFKQGLEMSSPEIIAQICMYGDALGWDSCLVVITSQDASGIKGEQTQQLKNATKLKKDGTPYKVADWALREDFNAKVQLFVVEMAHYQKTLLPLLKFRAEWLSEWKAGGAEPGVVKREHNPWRDNFPCGYCEFKTKCLADGEGELEAPVLPWML